LSIKQIQGHLGNYLTYMDLKVCGMASWHYWGALAMAVLDRRAGVCVRHAQVLEPNSHMERGRGNAAL